MRRHRRVLARRAAGRARHRTDRRRPLPNTPLRRGRQVVAAGQVQGQVHLVALSTWSFPTPFLVFLEEIRVSASHDLPGAGFCRVMIPVARLLLTCQLKTLLGIGSLNLVPTTLFRYRSQRRTRHRRCYPFMRLLPCVDLDSLGVGDGCGLLDPERRLH
ncbi:MAG: hypothetical protein JOZ41_00910 [Chloroflexi bacterium]|nr:hypothetical protein [Chloroflexota bacterium]